MNWIVMGALGLVVGGCEPAQTPERPERAAPGAQVADTLVISSDPELGRVVAELLPELASRSGLELRRPVRVETRSRDQLVSYLELKLDEELPEHEERLLTRSYALLGLVPEDLDLRGLLLSVYTEQVAGFYDPDSTALFVLDDQPAAERTNVLVHELVHAVQDQAANLDSLTDKARGNDRQTAAQAAIEGHATLVMLEYMMEQLQGGPVDLSEVEGFARRLRPALEAVRTQYPALAGAPRIVQESLLFAYLEGAGFVQAVWRQGGGRAAPFGEHLPQSTEQILHPERFLGPGRDDPVELTLGVPGATVLYSDVLGELETGLMLEELTGAADDGAAGWDGDRFALLGGEGGGGEALVWATVWDDADRRDRFVERLRAGLSGLPAAATVQDVDVEGLPGAVLRVGEVGDVDVAVAPSAATPPPGGAS